MFDTLSTGDIVRSLINLLAIIIAVSIFIQEKRAKTPPAPTMPWVRKTVAALFAEYIPADTTVKFVDLGCGWGGMVRILSRRFKKAEIHGYEISTAPFLVSKMTALFSFGRIKIFNSDMYKADLSQYGAIYCYLPTFILTDLLPQFATLRPGTLIITSGWAIPGYTPFRVEHQSVFGIKMPIHLYKIA